MAASLSDTVWLSEKRLNLLLLLMEGPRDIDQIKTSLNVTSRGMMPQIKKLKEKYLIVEDGGSYKLSNIGDLVIKKVLPLLNTLSMVSQNREYWEQRDLDILPPHLFTRIQELGNYLLIEPDLNYTFEIPREFTENLRRSRNINSIISFFRPEYPSLYCELLTTADKVTIILSDSVFERMKDTCQDELQTLMDSPKSEVYLYPENSRPPALDVSDWFMYISFFNQLGRYDHRDIMSFDDSALKWGMELFEHSKSVSKRIDG
ncbi:putative transcriptional regulator [Methanohalophilus levihalophilus]|uniref:helix-turn-helix transcriptional regulator n=1 Tax=Methanohalophilus levihalophilus TaxID=1431282 RepID=UPI001AE849E7|nr:winged helix-turn-helix domain-containing protein [Methanohalophilus levihalophilus]MBP2029796.1 putative transcriptional regulator [Methanohalophilus levihalophilus]